MMWEKQCFFLFAVEEFELMWLNRLTRLISDLWNALGESFQMTGRERTVFSQESIILRHHYQSMSSLDYWKKHGKNWKWWQRCPKHDLWLWKKGLIGKKIRTRNRKYYSSPKKPQLTMSENLVTFLKEMCYNQRNDQPQVLSIQMKAQWIIPVSVPMMNLTKHLHVCLYMVFLYKDLLLCGPRSSPLTFRDV